MSLQARIFLVLLSVALLPVLIAGSWFLRSNERVKENSQAMHRQLVSLAADAVETALGEFNRALAFAEDFDRIQKGPASGDSEYAILQNAATRHPAFSLLSVLDASGTEVLRVADVATFPGGFVSRSSDPVVQEMARTGKAALSPVTMQEGRPYLFIAYPLPEGRALYAAYSFQGLWRRLNDFRIGRTGRVVILDRDGKTMPGLSEDFPEKGWKGPGVLQGQQGWIEDIRTQAGTMVGAYSMTPSLSWTVLSLESRADAFAVGERFVITASSFLLALTLLVLCCALWSSARMTKPLLVMIEGARRVSRNDFSAPVPEIGWGELNLLSKSFNEMMSTLKTYQGMQITHLLEEKARVESLVHTIPDGIVMSNFRGEIMYLNLAARSVLGITEGPAGASHSVHQVIREPVLRDMILSLIKRTRHSARAELEIKGLQGQRVGIFACSAVTVMEGEREIGILIFLRDVTAEREMDHMKEEFLHSVVHDIRSPLATIDGFVQIMQERGQLAEKEKSYIAYIGIALGNLKQLVSDILDTAKIESGNLKLNLEPLALGSMIDKLRSLYSIQGETGKVEMRFVRGPDPQQPLYGDAGLIERVMTNLIGNALKFTPSGGRITVTAGAVSAQEIECSVADTGRGIPKDKLEFVFEKFKQLNTEGKVRSGYGLGLSICRKIVELHGGRIWAESELGQGSRFIFRLPLGKKQ